MDGSNPQMAKGWMDHFHHGKTGANAIDTHQHAYRPQQVEPAPAVNLPATNSHVAPLTEIEADALGEFKRLLNKRPARSDLERRVEQLVERVDAARNQR